MPLLETRASGSAIGYGLNSGGSNQPIISMSGTFGNLTYAYNGTGLTIPRNGWGYYQNLPSYLQGTVTNTSVNDGNFKFTTDKVVKVYLTRNEGWSAVDLTGWTNVVAGGGSYIGSNDVNNYQNMGIWERIFQPGTYTLSNSSAMYFWENAVIAPEQTSCSPSNLSYHYDVNLPRSQRTFYSGTTLNDLSGNAVNASFNNLTTGSDGKSIIFNGATSATKGTIVDSANATTSMSVDFWIKPTGNNAGWVRLFGKDPYSGGWLIFFETGSTDGPRKIRMLGITNTGEQRNNTNYTVPSNEWTHIVCTWEVGNTTGGLKLYANGTLVQQAPLIGTAFTTSAAPIAICGVESGEHFTGEIGSIRIYKQLVLNQREIAESYANGLMHKYGSVYTGRKAIVSPSVSGNTLWDFDSNGALNFGTQSDSQYIIPLGNYNVSTKIWGAGGGARLVAPTNQGGGGGYATVPSVPFTKGNVYALTVGAFGKRLPDNTTPLPNYPMGPGGGGQAAAIAFTGQGGGYSAIFAKAPNTSTPLVMAGGGGSGGVDGGTPGGAGGGATAQSGTGTNSGTGATSTAAGVNGLNNPAGSTAPGRLQGGSSGSGGDSGGGGGGGGGYWGGGAGYNGDNPSGNSGGGGGSGFIAPLLTGTMTTGSGAAPANDSDSVRGGSGNGANRSSNTDATDGRVYIL